MLLARATKDFATLLGSLGLADRRLVAHARAHFRDLAHAHRTSLARKFPRHVHKAAEIARKQRRCTACRDVRGLLLYDFVRNVRILHAECAAEAAADVRVLHLDQRKTIDPGKQFARLGGNAEFAQT